MVLVQNWSFLHAFILGILGQEKVFHDILEGKNAFLGYKNKKFKNSKNWDFSKGGKPMVLVENWLFLHLFISANIVQENVFYDILERKNAFLAYKKKKFKKSKNWDFSKGVNPRFWSKNGHFLNFFFFRQYIPRKCLLRYSRSKKRLSRLQKQEVQKVEKNWHFWKGP